MTTTRLLTTVLASAILTMLGAGVWLWDAPPTQVQLLDAVETLSPTLVMLAVIGWAIQALLEQAMAIERVELGTTPPPPDFARRIRVIASLEGMMAVIRLVTSGVVLGFGLIVLALWGRSWGVLVALVVVLLMLTWAWRQGRGSLHEGYAAAGFLLALTCAVITFGLDRG